MRSILMKQPGSIEIVEKEMPVRQPGEVMIKVLYGGLCGTDLNSYRGTMPYTRYPCTPGHEFSGEIVEVDENEFGLEKGMLVTCNPYFNCGKCYSCKKGFVNACHDNQTMGVQRQNGAFSEYICVPAERVYDGCGLPAKTLALIEPFCISYHGVCRAKVQSGENVLVLGAGTIGIYAALAAKCMGANVAIADIAPNKLEFAKQLGIENTILNSSDADLKKQVDKFTDGNGFEVCIEAVGLPSTFLNCVDSLAFGGRMVQMGVGNQNADFNYTLLQKKEICLMGSRNALKSDFVDAIQLVKKGDICPEKIISKVYHFTQAKEAFEDFDRNLSDILKIVLSFE